MSINQIASEAPVISDDAPATALAGERDRQIESGEVKAITHDELMTRLHR